MFDTIYTALYRHDNDCIIKNISQNIIILRVYNNYLNENVQEYE